MATARFPKTMSCAQLHTKENILAKLNTDLTEPERKSYLNLLLTAPETAHLLAAASQEWRKKLLMQHMEIQALEERIRIKNCYIDAHKNAKTLDADEKIAAMQQSIDEDSAQLKHKQSAFDTSLAHAEQSMTLLGSALNEMEQQINADQVAKNNTPSI